MESTKAEQRIEPVRKSIVVEAPVEHAVRVFTERLGEWWPVKSHSVHQELAREAGFEPKLGGRIFEVWRDGREDWGEVTAWEPPHRLLFSWRPGLPAAETTEVEVRFLAQGDSTLVELEHRGWEARGESALERRAGYDEGWEPVLASYAELASKR